MVFRYMAPCRLGVEVSVLYCSTGKPGVSPWVWKEGSTPGQMCDALFRTLYYPLAYPFAALGILRKGGRP